jgi:hypothetical protein
MNAIYTPHDLAYPLSDGDRADLERCEEIIESGLAQFVAVGKALARVRNLGLYREDYGSFETYCRRRWQMGRSYANKLISSSVVVQNLGTDVPILPASEAEARPLTALNETPKLQKQAWRTAVQSAGDGPITQDHVKAVVDGIKDQLPTPAALQEAEEKSSVERFKIVDAAAEQVPERLARREMRDRFQTFQGRASRLREAHPRETAHAFYPIELGRAFFIGSILEDVGATIAWLQQFADEAQHIVEEADRRREAEKASP